MKLLQKSLLAVCLPYALLILIVWIIQLAWLEPAERERIRLQTQRDLKVQAQMIRFNLLQAFGRLELLSQSPGLKAEDANSRLAEAAQLAQLHSERFAALQLYSFDPLKSARQTRTLNADDQEQLKQGQRVLSGFTGNPAAAPPTVSLMVPVTEADGSTAWALIGEILLTDLFPWLDPQVNADQVDFSLTDAQGRVINGASLQSATVRQRWARQAAWSDYDQERVATQIAPWNWQVVRTIHWSEQLAPLRFQRYLLSFLCLVAMILTMAAVVWLHRKSVSRMGKLNETIQVFGASDSSVRATDDSPDEIGKLAQTFNCMADDLDHTQRRLRKQLAEFQSTMGQTKELHAQPSDSRTEAERFAGVLAHEFQGPLVLLEEYHRQLETAARTGDWDQFTQDQARVRSISRQLQDLTQALLHLAKSSPPAEQCSLPVAAAEARELLAVPSDQLRISASLPTVQGHPVLWRHVLTNLLRNAMQAKATAIEIDCRKIHGQLACFVRDNGEGLTAQQIEQLFQGTGIGLPLVRRIVEHHGGEVWAESSGPGTGTTFWWTVSAMTQSQSA